MLMVFRHYLRNISTEIEMFSKTSKYNILFKKEKNGNKFIYDHITYA